MPRKKSRSVSRLDLLALTVNKHGNTILMLMALAAGLFVLLAIAWPDVWLMLRRWN